ncbi:hypothetical protein [Tunturiibacter gelidoferens]|uniref:Uncharacterized protein n=1 Tax=Tunturiibacter lichenicola TaxID=2051959 RepID=A0A7Y9NN23_9BACT|nr:hypothetical protein [Edaphobacter lichenicola]NYF52390.1 hypothetical protein [Edaphobacter lichenicola]
MTRKLYRRIGGGWVYWAGGKRANLVEERSPMKREIEFVGSFAMTVLLLAGSFAVAQSATTVKAKKPGAATTTTAVATSATAQSAAPAANAQATPAASGQTSGVAATTATTTTKPKTMVSADKRTIPIPQI